MSKSYCPHSCRFSRASMWPLTHSPSVMDLKLVNFDRLLVVAIFFLSNDSDQIQFIWVLRNLDCSKFWYSEVQNPKLQRPLIDGLLDKSQFLDLSIIPIIAKSDLNVHQELAKAELHFLRSILRLHFLFVEFYTRGAVIQFLLHWQSGTPLSTPHKQDSYGWAMPVKQILGDSATRCGTT